MTPARKQGVFMAMKGEKMALARNMAVFMAAW
jgi:hypothetical protein